MVRVEEALGIILGTVNTLIPEEVKLIDSLSKPLAFGVINGEPIEKGIKVTVKFLDLD